jgi:hypothetical protein
MGQVPAPPSAALFLAAVLACGDAVSGRPDGGLENGVSEGSSASKRTITRHDMYSATEP